MKEIDDLEIKCFLCLKIVEKKNSNKPISPDEEYHLSVDVPAIKVLRESARM